MIQRPPDFVPGNEIHKGFEAWIGYLDEVSSFQNPFRMDREGKFSYDPTPTVIPSDIALALQWYNLTNDGLKNWSIIRGLNSGWLYRHNGFRRGRMIMRADELGALADSVPKNNYYREYPDHIRVKGKPPPMGLDLSDPVVDLAWRFFTYGTQQHIPPKIESKKVICKTRTRLWYK